MINKWFKGELKTQGKLELINAIENNINDGPHYALKLYSTIELPIEFKERMFNIIIKNPYESYEYFKNEKLRKDLTLEQRKILFNSISKKFEYLGNFLYKFATTKEIAYIIKNLKLRRYYPQQSKKSYDCLVNSIMDICYKIVRFPLRNLLLNNGNVIFHFLETFPRGFSIFEIEHIYKNHRDIILKQNKTTYEKLSNYCNIFSNYITFEKDLLIDKIFKEDRIREAKDYLYIDILNFSKEQLERLESFVIFNKIVGGK